MFKINLEHNKGFKWNKSENIYSKGYLFDEKDNIYQGQNLNLYFNCTSEEDFKNKITMANGSFVVAIETKNKLFIAVDRLRSIPLFYAFKDNIFYISDNAYWIKSELDLKELDKISEQEFLLTGYVTGKDTLFSEIKQVRAGEYLIVGEKNGKITIKTNRYYRYLHKDFFTESKEELFNKLDNISENFISRLIKSVKGKTIVVPLSGGYDSRYIATMLKKLNYKNVMCFSYGKKGNWESEISKKVAKNLGYEWYFIEYTKTKWRDCFNSREIEQYLKYGNNLTSKAHLQDWPAVWELKKKSKIPGDAVFVPGHSGDLLGGSWTPKPLDISKKDYNLNDISEYLFKRHYCLFDLRNEHKKGLFLTRIKKELKDLEILIAENYVSLSDCWNITNRQAKFIVNSARVYEFFDYEWRIPLWDSELMDYWERVPLKFRINKELYDEYLFERLFNRFDIDFKIAKINKSSNLLLGMIKKLMPKLLKDIIKNKIIKKPDFFDRLEVLENYFHDKGIDKASLCDVGQYLARLNIWMLNKKK